MRVRRTWMSCAQRNELWARWRAGESLTDIGHALARGSGRIYTIVTAEGGVAPAPRRRSRLALTMAEREDISRGLASGMSEVITISPFAARSAIQSSAASIPEPAAMRSISGSCGTRMKLPATTLTGRPWRPATR